MYRRLSARRVANLYRGAHPGYRGRIVRSFEHFWRDRRPTDLEEITLLSSIADHIGLAVENVRLRQQAEQTAVQEDRQRLARELHDAVSQNLFSASVIAETLPRLWERDPVIVSSTWAIFTV